MKKPITGKTIKGNRRRRGREGIRWLDGIAVSMDVSEMNSSVEGDGRGELGVLQFVMVHESRTTTEAIN